MTPGYRVLAWTQTWQLIEGSWHRQAVALRLSDGARRLIAVPEVA